MLILTRISSLLFYICSGACGFGSKACARDASRAARTDSADTFRKFPPFVFFLLFFILSSMLFEILIVCFLMIGYVCFFFVNIFFLFVPQRGWKERKSFTRIRNAVIVAQVNACNHVCTKTKHHLIGSTASIFPLLCLSHEKVSVPFAPF